jgi:hypothetical protein
MTGVQVWVRRSLIQTCTHPHTHTHVSARAHTHTHTHIHTHTHTHTHTYSFNVLSQNAAWAKRSLRKMMQLLRACCKSVFVCRFWQVPFAESPIVSSEISKHCSKYSDILPEVNWVTQCRNFMVTYCFFYYCCTITVVLLLLVTKMQYRKLIWNLVINYSKCEWLLILGNETKMVTVRVWGTEEQNRLGKCVQQFGSEMRAAVRIRNACSISDQKCVQQFGSEMRAAVRIRNEYTSDQQNTSVLHSSA